MASHTQVILQLTSCSVFIPVNDTITLAHNRYSFMHINMNDVFNKGCDTLVIYVHHLTHITGSSMYFNPVCTLNDTVFK